MAFASGKTNMARRRALFGLGAALLVQACSPRIDYRGYQPRGNDLDQIRQGMSKSEVEALLGSPSTTATINTSGDSYFYISSKLETTAFFTPKEVERRVLAIRFDTSDRVQSFANYGLQDGKVVDYNTRVTPTTGKELTVVQQLLLNAGRFQGGSTGADPSQIFK